MRIAQLLCPLLVLPSACATSGTSAPTGGDDGGSSGSSSGSGSGGTSSGGGSSSSGGSGSSSSSGGGSTSSGGSGSSGSGGSGSGSGSGGSNDASAESGGPSDGGCGNTTPAIHDDFESASLGAWQVTDPFGNPLQAGNTQYSVTVDSVHIAHSGKHTINVHNGGLFGMAPPATAFYGRAWMWLGATPGTGHWGSIIGVGPNEGGQPVEVRMGGQFGILIYNYSQNDDVVLSDPNFFNDGMDGGTNPIVGTWTCVEFYFGKDALRTWIGGTEVTSLNVTPTTTWAHGMKAPWSPAYSSIRFGYANYNANAIDVWYDDVAIDTKRICCP